MYGVDPTSRESQEVVRGRLVAAYDSYKEHEARVRMRETHSWDSYYKRWFPEWPWDAIKTNEQELGQIDTLVALAKYFFPHMCLDFFVDQAGNPDRPSSQYLLMRKDLTPQQRYLLTGKTE